MKPHTTSPRHHNRQTPAAARAAAPARRRSPAGGKPLSLNQKATLCQLARQAYDHLDRLGLVDDVPGSSESARFAAWRAAQQAEAVGIPSLRDCGNNHYRTLRAHFNGLLGREDKAFNDYVKTGKAKDHGPESDTHEAREAYRKLIADELIAHGQRCNPMSEDYDPDVALHTAGKLITAAYITGIAKAKFKRADLASLTARELWQLLSTTRNRIATREGRPEVSGRNKSQKRKA